MHLHIFIQISPFSFFSAWDFRRTTRWCVRPLKKWACLVLSPAPFALHGEWTKRWLTAGSSCWVAQTWRRARCNRGSAAELTWLFPAVESPKGASDANEEEDDVFCWSGLRGEAKNDLKRHTRVRWKNVSLFSAVNSPGQQIWLRVPFPTCYKNWSPVQSFCRGGSG